MCLVYVGIDTFAYINELSGSDESVMPFRPVLGLAAESREIRRNESDFGDDLPLYLLMHLPWERIFSVLLRETRQEEKRLAFLSIGAIQDKEES